MDSASGLSGQNTVIMKVTLRQSDFGDGDIERASRDVTNDLAAQAGVAEVRVVPPRQPRKGLLPDDPGAFLVDIEVQLLATVIGGVVGSITGLLVRWARRVPERNAVVELGDRKISVKGDSAPEEVADYLLHGTELPKPRPDRPRSGRYALLITTSDYEDATLDALPGAESDGRLLADVLEDPEVGDYRRVQQLHNPAARAATRAVKMFFRERVAGDLALVYFSGHGLKSENKLFFATTDTDAAELDATSVPAELIAKEAQASKASQVVVILDCCYGGAFPAGHREHKPEQVQSTLNPIVSRHDFVLISATGETEFAVDIQSGRELQGTDVRHPPSLFTEVLIDGLDSGDADENGDGEVTPQELFDFLSERLAEFRSEAQAPILEERRRGAIVLAKSRQSRAVVPTQIRRKLADPATFATGLQYLLRHDERRRGDLRGVVVKTLLKEYTDGGDATRHEVVKALAKLAQRKITEPALPPRRRGRRITRPIALLAAGIVLVVAASVVGGAMWMRDHASAEAPVVQVSGEITINGSSTVKPVVDGVVETFRQSQPDTHVNVAGAGTGAGFKIFCGQAAGTAGIDLVTASRPIRNMENTDCNQNKIRYDRFLLGYDGMSVVTSTQNDFLSSLTYAQLRAIFGRPSLRSWRQVDPTFPDRPIATCTPDTGSGTFDFFVDHVLSGQPEAFREDGPTDVRSSDDNNLVQCVQANPYAVGFFGYAYYRDNAAKLKILAIAEKADAQPELPTEESVLADLYPLKRPLFVYARLDSLTQKPQVAEFLRFLIRNAEQAVRAVGYVPAYQQIYSDELDRIDKITE